MVSTSDYAISTAAGILSGFMRLGELSRKGIASLFFTPSFLRTPQVEFLTENEQIKDFSDYTTNESVSVSDGGTIFKRGLVGTIYGEILLNSAHFVLSQVGVDLPEPISRAVAIGLPVVTQAISGVREYGSYVRERLNGVVSVGERTTGFNVDKGFIPDYFDGSRPMGFVPLEGRTTEEFAKGLANFVVRPISKSRIC
jgi:hypothetical protein